MSKELDKINFQLDIIRNELNQLGKSEAVRRYNKLKFEYHELQAFRNEIYEKEKQKEFSTCNHIWVNGGMNSKYCLKCGLNTIYDNLEYINYDSLNLEERIVFNYLKDSDNRVTLDRGTTLDYDVDNIIVYEKYHELKSEHPDERDSIILRRLKEAIEAMKDVKTLARIKED